MFAGALIKAGDPGKPTDYYKLLKQHNRIDGEGIKQLLSGRKINAISSWTGAQIIWEWATNGECKYTMGNYQDKGKYWVEDNVLFIQFEKTLEGLPYGATIFKNLEGSKETQDEYFMVTDCENYK